MTLPFENDTKTIIKRISGRNISANRKRNIFIVLTIALASALQIGRASCRERV